MVTTNNLRKQSRELTPKRRRTRRTRYGLGIKRIHEDDENNCDLMSCGIILFFTVGIYFLIFSDMPDFSRSVEHTLEDGFKIDVFANHSVLGTMNISKYEKFSNIVNDKYRISNAYNISGNVSDCEYYYAGFPLTNNQYRWFNDIKLTILDEKNMKWIELSNFRKYIVGYGNIYGYQINQKGVYSLYFE